MKKTRVTSCCLLGLGLLTGTIYAQEKTELQFTYKQGETYRYRSDYSYDMTQEMNGQEMKMTGTTKSVIRLFVETVNADGDMTLINCYDELRSTMKNVMMDTTIEQKELIGKRGKVVITKSGKELLQQLIDTVKSEKGMATGNVASMYSVNFPILPDHPVALGDKWTSEHTDTVKVGDGSTITKSNTEYTLIQKEKKDGHECLNIGFVSKSETTGKMTQMGMEMFLEGDGETRGAIWLDPVLGIVVAKETTSTQNMTYALTGQMKMSIPSTQIIKSTYSLVE